MSLYSWMVKCRALAGQLTNERRARSSKRGYWAPLSRHIRRGFNRSQLPSIEQLESRCVLTAVDLAAPGWAGITLVGADSFDRSGSSVSNAGDVNGDGYDDLFIGASLSDSVGNTRAFGGESYLIFGGPQLPSTLDLANLGAAGCTIYGAAANDSAGFAVSSGGDVNGDGYDDLLIGAPDANSANNTRLSAGVTYVVFGGQNLAPTIDLANLGSSGITIQGAEANDQSGSSVSRAGDVNHDGFDDIIIGAPHANSLGNGRTGAGESYVIFGGNSLATSIDLASLGGAGTIIYGAKANDRSGVAVASAGDVNADGFDDVIIGADGANRSIFWDDTSATGASFIVYGGPSLAGTIDLGAPGFAGITIQGADPSDESGHAVAGVGDMNGDGFDDVIVGSYRANSVGNARSRAGESYVVFGGPQLPPLVTLASLGNAGITIFGADSNDWSGFAVSSAGDVNGDGLNDLLIGASHANSLNNGRTAAGEAYLIYGKPILPSTMDLSNLNSDGFTLYGVDAGDSFGSAVSNAGDVNGDGFDDLIVGAFFAGDPASGKDRAGESYVLYGGNFFTPAFASTATPVVIENQASVIFPLANDADYPAQSIHYTISGGVDQARFLITSNGELQFVSPPDYELPVDADGNNVYQLQITADDGLGRSVVQNMTVTVQPTNDNAPQFTSPSSLTVPENSVQTWAMTSTDADLPVQTIGYSITGGADQARFSMASGVLSFVSAPDFENPTDANADNTYEVQVTANDGQGGLTVQSIVITVTPVNDNSPVFQSPSNVSVAENVTTVGNVIATDADAGDVVSYSITGGVDQACFVLGNSGEIQFVTPPDYEQPIDSDGNNVYQLQITADDGHGRSVVQHMTVTVQPINDNAPQFTSPSSLTVPENSVQTWAMTSTDADLPSQTIGYSITGGADLARFSLTPSGVLSFVSPPDFENPTDANADNTYEVQVTANDGQGGLTVQSIVIAVTPVNDNSPVFQSPSNASVAENSTTVGNVIATDADAADVVTYSITGGADQARFAITNDGVLTFIDAPDFENPLDNDLNNSYFVKITVSDGTHTASQTLVVNVTPVNDNVPVFQSSSTFTIDENTTSVATASATDADLPANVITYAITGGLDQACFSISSDGILAFVANPDFENPIDSNTDNLYELQITASDGEGGTTVQDVTVTVRDVDDGIPVLALNGPPVTWVRKQDPVRVMPQLTLGGLPILDGAVLTISLTGPVRLPKSFDNMGSPAITSLGSTSGPQYENGTLTLQITLNGSATNATVQTFLRGLKISTKGRGFGTPTRTMTVELMTPDSKSGQVSQTIHLLKRIRSRAANH